MGEDQEKPRLGCAGVITKDNEVLLGRSNKPGMDGFWVLPGGGVDFGERLAATLVREIREETSLEIEPGEVITVDEIVKPGKHRVIVYLRGEVTGGTATPSDDLAEVGFFDQAQVRQMRTEDKVDDLVIRVLTKAGWLK